MPPKCNNQIYICTICSKNIKYKNVIRCKRCNDCYHFRCVGICSVEEHRAALDTWKCASCASDILTANTSLPFLLLNKQKEPSESRMDDIEKKMEKYEGMLEKQTHCLLEDIESQFDQLKSAVDNNISEVTNEIEKLNTFSPTINEKIVQLNDRLTKLEDKVKFLTSRLAEDDENTEKHQHNEEN